MNELSHPGRTPAHNPIADDGDELNFCSTCGTKLYLAFERFPTAFGVYAGTFDDPNWFARIPKMSKHIFLTSAQNGTVIPPGIPTYREHEMLNDGTPNPPTTFEQPHTIDQSRLVTREHLGEP